MFPSDIYMGVVYDALRLMGESYRDFYINIKPTCGYNKIVHGEVFTTYGEVVDVTEEEYSRLDNIRLEFYDPKLFSKSPIIFLQSNDDEVAHSGDITSLIYQKLGASGFVTDGNVRDIDIIETMNFPVFCRGENPIDAIGYWALTKYQVDIEIDGVRVSPGDYSFASRDGVIVVRQNIFEDFKRNVHEQLSRENTIRSKINSNDFDFKSLVDEFGRW